jgi:hypothetical protein
VDYSTLIANIQDTTEKTFTSDELAMFVQQAEQFIYSAVQFPALRRNQLGDLTAGNNYLTLPSDFLNSYSLAVIGEDGAYHYLLDKDANFIRDAYPNPSSTGLPKHYALFDDVSIIIGPTPDASYVVELHYGYYPQSIVTAGSTWLGEKFDIALFDASLVQAARFMKSDPDIIQLYEKMMTQSISMLKSLGEGKLRRDAYRSGQNRTQVL